MSLRHKVTWVGLQAIPHLLQHDLENTKADSEDLARHHDDHWAGRPNRLSTESSESKTQAEMVSSASFSGRVLRNVAHITLTGLTLSATAFAN